MEITIKNLNNLDWIDLIAKIAPVIIGICSVIVTILFIYVTYRLHSDAKKEKRRETIARYYEIFTSNEFHTVRGLAWRAMEKFYLDEKFKDNIYEYPKDASKIFAFYTIPESDQREISAVWRMIEFLSLIESSGADEEILIQCGFYYDSWRIFLLDWCKHVEEQYNEGIKNFVKVKVEEESKQTQNAPILDSGKYSLLTLFRKSSNGQTLTEEKIKEKIKKQFQLPSPIAQFRKLDERLIKKSIFHESNPNWHIIYYPLTEDALKINGLKETYKKSKNYNFNPYEEKLRLLELVREWNSKEINSCRQIAGKLLRENPFKTLKELHDDFDVDYTSIAVVISFFTDLKKFIDDDIISSKKVTDKFGKDFIWWDEVVFKDKDENSPNWGKPDEWDNLKTYIKESAEKEPSLTGEKSVFDDWQTNGKKHLANYKESAEQKPRLSRKYRKVRNTKKFERFLRNLLD